MSSFGVSSGTAAKLALKLDGCCEKLARSEMNKQLLRRQARRPIAESVRAGLVRSIICMSAFSDSRRAGSGGEAVTRVGLRTDGAALRLPA